MPVIVSNVLRICLFNHTIKGAVDGPEAAGLADQLRSDIERAFATYALPFTPQTLQGTAVIGEQGIVIDLYCGVRQLEPGEDIWLRRVKCFYFTKEEAARIADSWYEEGWEPECDNCNNQDADMWHVIELPGNYALVIKITEWLEEDPEVVPYPSYSIA